MSCRQLLRLYSSCRISVKKRKIGVLIRRNLRPSGIRRKSMPATKLQIKLVRSPIGYEKSQRATLRALGLYKLHQTVQKDDTPAIRGMVTAVAHLVVVEENQKEGHLS